MFALLLLLVMAAGCKSASTVAPPAPPSVTVAHPVTRAVADYLDFTGNTAAINAVTLVARVEGYLEKIHFTDGADVKKGKRWRYVFWGHVNLAIEKPQVTIQ